MKCSLRRWQMSDAQDLAHALNNQTIHDYLRDGLPFPYTDYVFTTSTIVRISAESFAKNHSSCRVLEKAGFTLEGVLRKHAEKNQQLFDMKLYALVRQEKEGQDDHNQKGETYE